MKTIGVYGSLKAGCYNNDRFNLSSFPRLKDATIVGAMKLVMGAYPALYERGQAPSEYERDHVLEIYQIPEDLYERIEGMEIGAGYYPQVVSFALNPEVIVFFMSSDQVKFTPETFIEKYPV